MPSKDVALQSRESSSASAEQVDDMTGGDDQGIKTEFTVLRQKEERSKGEEKSVKSPEKKH